RGWLYWHAASGAMYLLRGALATKYQPDDTSDEWPIVEYHYFGDGLVVAGKPAEFQGKLYVPLVDISTPGTETLARWHELATVNTTVTEVVALTQSGSPTGGSFSIGINAGAGGVTFSGVDWDISAADLQALIRTVSGLTAVTVERTGHTSNFVWTITHTNALSS